MKIDLKHDVYDPNLKKPLALPVPIGKVSVVFISKYGVPMNDLLKKFSKYFIFIKKDLDIMTGTR